MKFVVAFSSPKRSSTTVERAAAHAKALNAELVLLRIVPDPSKVGVIAQLISTDRPMDKAKKQVDAVVANLKERGINASGQVRVGAVADTINKVAQELGADLLFVGTADIKASSGFFMKSDPIVKYLVEHCPISLMLVRTPISVYLSDEEGDEVDLTAEELSTPDAPKQPPS